VIILSLFGSGSILLRYHSSTNSVNDEIQVPVDIGYPEWSIPYEVMAAPISWIWLILRMSRLSSLELLTFGRAIQAMTQMIPTTIKISMRVIHNFFDFIFFDFL
jgi:hypothetical protein